MYIKFSSAHKLDARLFYIVLTEIAPMWSAKGFKKPGKFA